MQHHVMLFARKSPGLCTISVLLYLTVWKTISPGCGLQASPMLFLGFLSIVLLYSIQIILQYFS